MSILDGMVSFVTVVEQGSFTKAAETIGQTKSAMSKHITKLEERLGVKLINRTTRKLTLTDAGQSYFEKARQIIEQAEQAEAEVTASQAVPRGKLRVTMPISFGNTEMKSILPGFLKQYPDLEVEFFLSDQIVDLMEGQYEIAIRIGHLKDSSLIARRIGTAHSHILASPDYWEKYGIPQHPDDLRHHNCMRYTNLPNPIQWTFLDKDKKQISVRIDGKFSCNNGEMEINLAKAGLGICRVPAFLSKQEIEDGSLIPVLEDYSMAELGIYAVYLPTRHIPPKIRAFIDYMAKHISTY